MIQRLISWYGKKTVIAVAAIIAILAVVGVGKMLSSAPATTESEDTPAKLVTVAPVTSFDDAYGFTVVGSVEAVSEAVIQSEVSGRLTSVRVGLGDTVAAGQILATLENSSQRAAVTQAEGSYEAAVAAAAQSDIGVTEANTNLASARQSALSTIRGAYTTAQGAVYNNFDQFYANPRIGSTPGLRITGTTYTDYLNNQRVELRTILSNWQKEVNALSPSGNVQSQLQDSIANIEEVIATTEAFIAAFQRADTTQYTRAELNTFSTNFTTLLSNLNSERTSLTNAEFAINNAEDALARTELGGTVAETSAANAQIKQARGALESAQANLAKTIIRAPISGEVTSLDIKNGNFISAFSPLLTVTNSNALQITTYVTQENAAAITAGDAVLINGEIEGRVARIANSIDAATGKKEVLITTDDARLTSGDRVNISLTTAPGTEETPDIISIPLTAVKLAADASYVFTVEDDTLVAHEVTLGEPSGSSVVVTSGIDTSWQIVTDARGLSAGTHVTVVTN